MGQAHLPRVQARGHDGDHPITCFPWISISMFLWDEAKRSAREMKSVVLAGRDLAAGNLMMK